MNESEVGADNLLPLAVVDTPDVDDLRFLEDRVDEENMARTGISDARLLVTVVRDRDQRIGAGVHGWTWGGCCEVRTLWVHPAWRKRGIGTRVMAAAEREARVRGAAQITLSTHSFQAPAFYRRLGYEIVGEVDGYPVGHRSIYLRKFLNNPIHL